MELDVATFFFFASIITVVIAIIIFYIGLWDSQKKGEQENRAISRAGFLIFVAIAFGYLTIVYYRWAEKNTSGNKVEVGDISIEDLVVGDL